MAYKYQTFADLFYASLMGQSISLEKEENDRVNTESVDRVNDRVNDGIAKTILDTIALCPGVRTNEIATHIGKSKRLMYTIPEMPTHPNQMYRAKAFLTLKDHAVGLVRHEFEYPIPVGDAETILDTMCGNLVEKNRYRISAKEPGLVWEVDEFFGDNAPLVTAEIELPDENTVVQLPDWIGLEVTNDHRYKNNNLAAHPFSEW